MIVILGHTAAGKTAVAARVANRLRGEVISADSRQVYRGMDIGTGKDYDDYMVDGSRVPVHLIDIVDAGVEYNLFRFQQDFSQVCTSLMRSSRRPVLCGGSGLYIESVIKNYRLLMVPPNVVLRAELEGKTDEQLGLILKQYGPLHNITDTVSRKRLIRAIEIAEYQSREPLESSPTLSLKPLVVGIAFDRENRRRRITERLTARLEAGMIDEVRHLLESGVDHDKLRYYGLEYKYISMYLEGALNYEEMVARLNTAIHRFAKRQMTYFRGMERRGIEIRWLRGALPPEEKVSRIVSWFSII
ncbi:MAG: tRNA (adenosine(37)-N6)-dimethylallyltransferase MiaA [Bacteroidales bacterium]|nr:tRNA (adenosine(37)-N6)-dimethylallyltransferase MiaA [Bacteroidales bacterium]MBN2698326.1 tRNA (adenosine(37)-N6)-dimethylallyltransferase MiaA [Bacteroidales bacterium]